MITTSFTKLVGVSAPIQLAAMPAIATPELVAAGFRGTDFGGRRQLNSTIRYIEVLSFCFRNAT